MHRFVIVIVLALSGCAQLLEPDEDTLLPSNLAVELASVSYLTGFAVEGMTGSILVQDRTITGICHKRENHGAYLEGSVVTLWFAHTGNKTDVCPAVGVIGGYRATIQGLAPGTYLLRVQYIGHIDTDTYPRPELEWQVTVQ